MAALNLASALDAAASALPQLAIKTAVVLAAAAVLAFALRGRSAATRHLVWAAAIASALVLPLAQMLPVRLAVLPASLAGTASPAPSIAPRHAPAGAVHDVPAPPSASAASPGFDPPQPAASSAVDAPAPAAASATAPVRGLPTPAPAHWPPATLDAGSMLVRAWLLGALLLLVRLGTGMATLWWMARTGIPVEDERWTALAERIRRDFGGPRARLIRTRMTEMPMTCGIMRPVILLPADCTAWPDERRDVVLRHELAHVARRDILTITLAQIVRAWHWYNPLSWVALHGLRAEAERCCDDLVLGTGTRASAYAAHLLEMIRTTRRVQRGAGLALPMAHRTGFETRLHAILNPAICRAKPGWQRGSAVAATFAALVALLAIAAPVRAAADQVFEAPRGRMARANASIPAAARIPSPAPVMADSAETEPPAPDAAASDSAANGPTPNDSTPGPARSVAGEVPSALPVAPLAAAPAVAADPVPAPVADEPAPSRSGRFAVRLASPGEAPGRTLHVALWTPGLNTFYIPIDRLDGFEAGELVADGGPVRFRLRHDAGTFIFEGEVRSGRGTGQFGFVPDPSFGAELARRGMDRPTPEQQFSMARHDVSLAFIDELARHGYARPTTASMERLGLTGVDLEYVREMASLGYRMGTVDVLRRMANHSVDPQFIRALAALGYRGLPVDDLVRLRNYPLTAALIREMNTRAGRRLSVPELVRAYNDRDA
ncbi:MAG TPA: M56 family metallopeptidase [Longimicrobium sp.]|uniref:M56 family metallopeptidase n=1 Tax=Longimicrobium sp. TaxID=2029185 RepID=UPI002ED91961